MFDIYVMSRKSSINKIKRSNAASKDIESG